VAKVGAINKARQRAAVRAAARVAVDKQRALSKLCHDYHAAEKAGQHGRAAVLRAEAAKLKGAECKGHAQARMNQVRAAIAKDPMHKNLGPDVWRMLYPENGPTLGRKK
jgi:nitrate/TMAO reductase-like tetraheme cytochrome c subunit